MVVVYGLLVAEAQYEQTGQYDAQETQGGLQVAPLLRVLRHHLLHHLVEQAAHVRVAQPEQLAAELGDGRIDGGGAGRRQVDGRADRGARPAAVGRLLQAARRGRDGGGGVGGGPAAPPGRRGRGQHAGPVLVRVHFRVHGRHA